MSHPPRPEWADELGAEIGEAELRQALETMRRLVAAL
jgi:hypothetical protein